MQTAKEYLCKLEKLDVLIKNKKDELNNLRQMATSIASKFGETVKSTPTGDTQERKILEWVALEEEIENDMLDYMKLKNKISNQIGDLEDVRYVKLLYKRYVEHKRLKVVAREMHYDYQWTKTLHGEALQEFERTYLNIPKDVLV
ncbi:MAG: hypothetical protein KBT03_04860 [Bacteroidales bacterium]|nr:hypothetical protein [Candidatus Scybalousia scybalohippi]